MTGIFQPIYKYYMGFEEESTKLDGNPMTGICQPILKYYMGLEEESIISVGNPMTGYISTNIIILYRFRRRIYNIRW